MSATDVAVVDYDLGNLLSVRRGLEHCGASVTVSEDPAVILAARRVVLPGVGAFADGMAELRRRGLDDVVREVAARGVPLMGICLGMQMLLDESEEFGLSAGLGLIAGRVIAVPDRDAQGIPHKIPHIGWSSLVLPSRQTNWRDTPLSRVQEGDAVYFVHSFMADPADPECRIANCLYAGVPVPAAVGFRNVFGCQFHPEKSGEVGLTILRTFLAQ
jgi:glutamine amidotransferase